MLKISDQLSLPLESVTQTFAVLAKRGAGKTYSLLVMAEEMIEAKQTVVVADPVGVAWGLRASADGKGPGLPIIILGGDHGDIPLEATGGALVADLVVDDRVSVVLDLSLFRKAEQVRFMAEFAGRLYLRNREPLHLFLDEADEFAPQRPGKDQLKMLGAIEDLVRRGRARGIGITMATQRSAVLNKNVLTQIEVLIAMRTPSPQDQAAIDAWIQVHGTPQQRAELMRSLASLPIGTAWFWSPGWLDVFKLVQVRRRKTFDSSATPGAGGRAKRQPKNLAEVDLSALQERMKATIEKAKADDPKELKRRIAALEKQLAERPKEQIEKTVEKIVEVPVLKNGQLDRTEKIAERLQLLTDKFLGETQELRRLIGAATAPRPVARPAARPAPEVVAKPAATPQPRSQSRPTAAASGAASSLTKGDRIVLAAVAQYESGVTRETLTVLTGYKRSSRDTYLQRLRSQGYVDQSGDLIVATPSGIEALGDDFEPLPTGVALQQYWLDRLGEGERNVFSAVLNYYPRSVDRTAIDEETGYKRSSRDTYLQRLRARQLVEFSGRGEVRASDVLFE